MFIVKCLCCERDVHLDHPSKIRLVVGDARARYGFRCPLCREYAVKPADDDIVRLLLSGGVLAQMERVPAEALEAHDGPDLTEADAIAFARDLAGL